MQAAARRFPTAVEPVKVNLARQPGLRSEARQGQGGEGRQLRGLKHDRAAGGQGRRDLAGDHGGGEVPGGHGRDHADRLLQNQEALVRLMSRDDVAISSAGLLGEPFDEGGGVGDLALGLRQGLALLGRQQTGQVRPGGHDTVIPAPEQDRALLRRPAPPGGQSLPGGGHRRKGVLGAEVRNPAQDLAAGRVGHLDPGLSGALDAADPGGLTQEPRAR